VADEGGQHGDLRGRRVEETITRTWGGLGLYGQGSVGGVATYHRTTSRPQQRPSTRQPHQIHAVLPDLPVSPIASTRRRARGIHLLHLQLCYCRSCCNRGEKRDQFAGTNTACCHAPASFSGALNHFPFPVNLFALPPLRSAC
jgi:hypothetical protein